MTLAYSYLRFSSPQQASGDSLRRQGQSRDAWLAAHTTVRLDTSLKLTDAGRSAFRRTNWDTYALARFVDHIKSGRVQPGSYLLVENLDRLSREDAGEATELFLSIVNKGVVIVQLSPVVMEFRRPVNVQSLMFAIVELSRGHSESAIKSERGRAAWGRKQREAATRLVTRKLPGWVRYEDGKLILDPDRAAVVSRMFAMARDGHGVQTIAQVLNADRVPVMGRTVVKGRPVAWSATNIWHILKSPAAIGEYVPYRRRKGADAPPPVPNYFPPVVTPDAYHAVQAALATRSRVGRGRRGKFINLFSGLLRDARDGGTLTYWTNGGHPPVLIPVNAKEGRGVWSSFPATPFDEVILSQLVEVSPAEVDGGGDARQRVEALAGRAAELEKLVRVWTAKMDDPSIADTVATKLAEYKTKLRRVNAELAEAQRAAASPVGEMWGELRTLADPLREDGSDEMRTRVRAALRRSIESVTCLFVARGRTRFAAVRVQFAGSAYHRDYLLRHRMAFHHRTKPRPAHTEPLTFADAVGQVALDLRNPAHAKKLEAVLMRLDVIALPPAGQTADRPEPESGPSSTSRVAPGAARSGRRRP